ncbi:phosphoribosylamine--glycine ligase [Dethiosulfatarculus sandiegensis]|uniref:Multifunctional fusion protein n=1 Tax=Dethiosulfatarculus sandiegensis TaxID=1429043 RepID=A0A0D2J8S1_9BACT|nr:phosphoribosylamine--glycine ligase [Dethiosulfatarculus sandiegensis]KIX14544.1 phosphoribosylamine--glycine ligase [Dethiosulfatarculus sandiegensis]
MKVLVVGSGGREHALVWKLAQSPKVKEVFCAPGNAGIKSQATCVDIKADDIEGLKAFAADNAIDLTLVGPEVPLVTGIADEFEAAGLKVVGPDKYCSQLEGSKSFAKDLMAKYQVSTAPYRVFYDHAEALAYVRGAGRRLVVKADGLCAGKGVTLCKNTEQAEAALDDLMVKKVFGEAGAKVVIEEWLNGEEASFMVFSDGDNVLAMPSSQDHKAVGEGDTGANTGGMGAYSPAPVVTTEISDKVLEKIICPMIHGLKAEGHPYRGVLYAGLMISEEGEPSVVEFNVRFGDPECQPLMLRLGSDLAEICQGMMDGNLGQIKVHWHTSPAVCVVLAAEGYPASYDKGKEISGLEEAAQMPQVEVFQAGTSEKDGKYYTNGGRVLGVTARGQDIKDAIDIAYKASEIIKWEGQYYRKDIGHRALTRSEKSAQVGVIMGSASDWDAMKGAVEALRILGVKAEVRVLSAHRTPEQAVAYARQAPSKGIKVIIAGAGWAAHLAGAMAAHSILPVIGVPMDSSPLNGMDALLSTVQMPPGIPVATVAIGSGGARNAGILAAQILALSDENLAKALKGQRKKLAQKVLTADETMTQRALAGEPFFE